MTSEYLAGGSRYGLEEVAALTRKLAHRITRHVDASRETHGFDLDTAACDECDALDHARAGAVQIPLGPRSGGTAAAPPLREPYRRATLATRPRRAFAALFVSCRLGL
jgi:hypothetical protein